MTQANPLTAYAIRKDPEAFAQVVERYQRLILATCRRRLQNAADVDDAVQETFLRLAQRAGQVHTNLGAWLHTCAVNVSIDINRRQSSRARHESAAAKPVDPADDPKRTLAELREHLDAALQKLDAEQRELIIQRYFIGRSQIELAEEAGVAPSTIGHRLEKAVERLRIHLKTMGCIAAIGGGAAALTDLLEAESASAAVSPPLTANVMRIGLSGTPAAEGALLGGLLFKLFATAAAVLLIAAGIWFSIPHHQAPVAQAAPAAPIAPPAPQSQTSGTPAITASSNSTDQSTLPPHWNTTQPANIRAVLAGRVLDNAGKPIANATITLSNVGHAVTKSDAQGNYSFATITRTGEGQIDVEADGYVPIESGGNDNPSIQLSPQSQARRDLVMERGVRVTVTLTDSHDQPVRRAHVEADLRDVTFRRRAGPNQDSNEQGEAHLVLPISKTPYVLSATFEGCAPAHAIITADSADKPQDVVLYLGPGMSVKGTAICSDGKPAAGWTLFARPDWWSSNYYPAGAKIDKDGSFTLTNILAGQYALEIDVPNGSGSIGHRLGSVTLPPTTQPLLVNIPLPSPASMTKLTGRLRISGGGPRFVEIHAWNPSSRADSSTIVVGGGNNTTARQMRDGIPFTLENLPPGVYRLSVESSELEPIVIENVAIPGDLPTIDAKFAGPPHLTGTVTDAATGNPIAHFAVRARKIETLGNGQNYDQDNRWTQVSDPRGHFDVQLIGPGVYQVQVSLDGYAWMWSPEVRFEKSGISQDIQLKATAGGSLTGHLLDPAGKPIAGAKVIPLSMAKSVAMEYIQRFESDAGAAITDSNGRFLIPHLAPGDETLKILHHDFAPVIREKFKVTENQVNDIGTISLQTGGSVEGIVFDEHGVPSPNVSLEFLDADGYAGGPDDEAEGRFALATTDQQGHYRVEHLPQQIIYINYGDRWDHPRSGVIRRVVRPMDGQTAHLDFGGTLPVKGRLLSNSKPVPGSSIELSIVEGNFGAVMVKATTDANGRFLFMGPPIGRYTLFCERPDSRSDWITLKSLDVSDQPIDLGDVSNDVGDVTIALTADDPADINAIQFVSVQNDNPMGMWQEPVARATPDASSPGHWKAINVPVGHFRISASATRGYQGPIFFAPLDHKPLPGQTQVELHLPRASATLKVALKNPTGDPIKPSYVTFRSISMTTTIVAVPLQPVSFKLPPGSYQVFDSRTLQPRSDIPPIAVADGESKQVDIDLNPSPENRPAMVDLSLWSADGVLITNASAHLLDATGNTIQSTRATQTGQQFIVRPGHYRAILETPGRQQSTQDIEVPPPGDTPPFHQINIDLNLPPEK